MKTFAVWLAAYPHEPSLLFRTWTKKGARRKFRRETCQRGAPSTLADVTVREMDADALEERFLLG